MSFETQEDFTKGWVFLLAVTGIIGVIGYMSASQTYKSEAPFRFDQNKTYVSMHGTVLKRVTPSSEDKEHVSLLSVEFPTYGLVNIQPWGISDTSNQESIDSLVEGDCILASLPDAGALSTQRYLKLHRTLISPIDCKILDEYNQP